MARQQPGEHRRERPRLGLAGGEVEQAEIQDKTVLSGVNTRLDLLPVESGDFGRNDALGERDRAHRARKQQKPTHAHLTASQAGALSQALHTSGL